MVMGVIVFLFPDMDKLSFYAKTKVLRMYINLSYPLIASFKYRGTNIVKSSICETCLCGFYWLSPKSYMWSRDRFLLLFRFISTSGILKSSIPKFLRCCLLTNSLFSFIWSLFTLMVFIQCFYFSEEAHFWYIKNRK